jgi:hypothetical protein
MNDLKESLQNLKAATDLLTLASVRAQRFRSEAAQQMLNAGITETTFGGKCYTLRKLTRRKMTDEGFDRLTSGYTVRIGPDYRTIETMKGQRS